MKWQTLALAALVYILPPLHTGIAQESKRLINMACSPFAPYKIGTAEQGREGIDVEVMRAAFAQSGHEISTTFYPWKRSKKLVETGQADGLCGCSYLPEREEVFRFSDLLGNHSQGVFLANGVELERFDSLEDLRGLTVAAVRGYAPHQELLDHGIKVQEATDDQQLLSMLQNERVQAIYSYRDIVLYTMSHQGGSGNVQYRELNSQPYYLCFSEELEDVDELLEDFNRGLRVIRYNGTYQKIWKSYQ